MLDSDAKKSLNYDIEDRYIMQLVASFEKVPEENRDLQASNNHIEHSGESVSSIGNVLVDNNASEPN